MVSVPDLCLPELRDERPLVIKNVVKFYDDFQALKGVDLEIEPGEIFALLGPNGAGKSTLIHCITGLASATKGDIEVFGYPVNTHFREARRLIGLVPQEIGFDPFFTPHESLVIQMGLMGVTPDPKWADEILKSFALFQKRDAYTRSLSGGMKRRLLVAKALVHRPKLLFLDGPTAGVDVKLRQDLWRNVRALRHNGTTVILTTHYLEEAEELADRIGVIHRGEIILVEEREALLKRFQKRRLILTFPEKHPHRENLPSNAKARGENQLCFSWSNPQDLKVILASFGDQAIDSHFEQTRLEDIFVDLIRQAEKDQI